MRIALLNIDSLASNQAIRSFIERNSRQIVLLGLSPPFCASRGGMVAQTRRHLRRSGLMFTAFLNYNFVVPRIVGSVVPQRTTLAGLAKANGIAVARVEDVNGPEMVALLRDFGVDLIVSCYFDQIMRPEVIELPRHGVVNVHSSLLPMHRGPMPVLYACLDNPPQLGITIHRVDAGVDTGPILARRTFEAPPGQSVLALTGALHMAGIELLEDLLPAIEAGQAQLTPQVGGSYESFPDRTTIARLGKCGRRLFDLRDVLASMCTPMRT